MTIFSPELICITEPDASQKSQVARLTFILFTCLKNILAQFIVSHAKRRLLVQIVYFIVTDFLANFIF